MSPNSYNGQDQVYTFNRPFIRLPEPHSSIIIAVPSLEDISQSVQIMNNPSIGKWVLGSTEPYTAERAEQWIAKVARIAEVVLERSRAHHFVDECPFRHIVKLSADGSHEFIGDIGISRSNWADILDKEQKAVLLEENNSRVAGDEEIVFQMGYYLAPEHHRRGIMKSAMSTVLTKWAIPRMNAHRIKATMFRGNLGSEGVLINNGFALKKTIGGYKAVDGELLDLLVFEWEVSKSRLA